MAEDFTLYSDETLKAEDKAFMLKLRDTTMAAIEESRFAQVVDKLKERWEGVSEDPSLPETNLRDEAPDRDFH